MAGGGSSGSFCPRPPTIVHFLIQVKPPTNAQINDGVSLLSRRKRLMASKKLPLILAIGAAGKLAGMVVPELTKRGANVRGFVRSSDEIEVVKTAGAEDVIVGDLTDKAGVRRAMEGVVRVFYIAPAFLPNGAEVGVAVVEAATDAAVKRLVFSSVIHPVLGELANHAAKAPVEGAALSSGLEYTFLHPRRRSRPAPSSATRPARIWSVPFSSPPPPTPTSCRGRPSTSAAANTCSEEQQRTPHDQPL